MATTEPVSSATEYVDGHTAPLLRKFTHEELLEARICISVETQESGTQLFSDAIQENPLLLFELLQAIDYDEQDLLLSYFLVGKSQTLLAKIFGITQSNLNLIILNAVARLGRVAQNENPYFKFRVGNLTVKGDRRKDPPELGMFRVDVTSRGFASMFTARVQREDLTADVSAERLKPHVSPPLARPDGRKTDEARLANRERGKAQAAAKKAKESEMLSSTPATSE